MIDVRVMTVRKTDPSNFNPSSLQSKTTFQVHKQDCFAALTPTPALEVGCAVIGDLNLKVTLKVIDLLTLKHTCLHLRREMCVVLPDLVR